MAIEVDVVDGPMGAIIRGLDSRKPLSDADFRTVEQAMIDHIAIVVLDLEENVPWLRDFGRRFGPQAASLRQAPRPLITPLRRSWRSSPATRRALVHCMPTDQQPKEQPP